MVECKILEYSQQQEGNLQVASRRTMGYNLLEEQSIKVEQLLLEV